MHERSSTHTWNPHVARTGRAFVERASPVCALDVPTADSRWPEFDMMSDTYETIGAGTSVPQPPKPHPKPVPSPRPQPDPSPDPPPTNPIPQVPAPVDSGA